MVREIEAHYGQSLEAYSEAIKINPNSAVYYANRAFAHIKMEAYGAALTDANSAIELDPDYVKGYYRRGSANFCLGHYKEALKDFKRVVKLKPRNATARNKLKECEKAVKRMAFGAAIASGEATDEASPFDNLDYDSIAVEDSYTGPRFDGDITVSFVEELIATFKAQGKLHRKYALKLLALAKPIFAAEPSLVDVPVNDAFTVCGDVHGQFYDFCNIFELNGPPSETNPYLFNGDFVDRGSFGVEIIFTMLAYKVLYPKAFFMTRGNHESKNMNQMYGFEGEVKAKYDDRTMRLFTDLFNSLPLCVVLGGKVIVMHGGLFSRDDVTLDDIRAIDRFCQPPDEGLMCEILWSDPHPYPGRAPSKRGVGVAFGPDVTKRFLEANGLELLVRSHEVKDEGYLIEADGKLITVFSAPNYCDQVGNKGAFIRFDSELKPHITSFEAVPHPNVKPMAYAGPSLMSLFGL